MRYGGDERIANQSSLFPMSRIWILGIYTSAAKGLEIPHYIAMKNLEVFFNIEYFSDTQL